MASDLHTDRKVADKWDSAAAAHTISESSRPGEHTVEIDLRFRVHPSDDNLLAHPSATHPKCVFSYLTSRVSEPIASGGFTLVVPTAKVPRRSVLPAFIPQLTDTP